MAEECVASKGITFPELIRVLADVYALEQSFAKIRWPRGLACPHCCLAIVLSGCFHPSTPPQRCRPHPIPLEMQGLPQPHRNLSCSWNYPPSSGLGDP